MSYTEFIFICIQFFKDALGEHLLPIYADKVINDADVAEMAVAEMAVLKQVVGQIPIQMNPSENIDQKTLAKQVFDIIGPKFDMSLDVIEQLIVKCNNTTSCSKFAINADFFREQKHNTSKDEPTMSEIITCFSCQKCGKLTFQHQLCDKYEDRTIDEKDEFKDLLEDNCNKCGLNKYEHKACDIY